MDCLAGVQTNGAHTCAIVVKDCLAMEEAAYISNKLHRSAIDCTVEPCLRDINDMEGGRTCIITPDVP